MGFKKTMQTLIRDDMDIRQKLLNLMLICTFGGGVMLLLVSLLLRAASMIICTISVLLFSVCISLWISVRKNQPQIAAIVLVMVANMGVFPVMYFLSGGMSSGIPVWQVFGLIFSWLLLDGLLGVLVYILSALVCVGCIGLEMIYPTVAKTLEGPDAIGVALIQSILVVTCVLGIVFKYQIYEYERKHRELQKSDLEKGELNEKQRKLLQELNLKTIQAEQRREKVELLSEQIMLTLATAIDAKDRYTNGHSLRVAEYAREIAKRAGKTKQEQQDIYYIGLLHDIGKIGVPNNIINKTSGLTQEEYEVVKDHTEIGAHILREMTEIPGLAVGAHWHHELYNGKGYPDGLKGTEIPEIARIICVADAYDAMTSKRSYRDVMPQQEVMNEFWNGRGTQFDPLFATIMLEIMSDDKEYRLRERSEY